MKTSIVIPLFGPEHFLIACLEAIEANTEGDYETVVVDNGMGYAMAQTVHLGPVIRHPDNRGFAVACNAGARAAQGEQLCFLNVDTEVQPGWLAPLVEALDDHEVVMSGPRIVHPNGSLQTSGIRTWHGNGNAGGEELKDDGPSRDVDGVTGACMMIRKTAFMAVGGFCELYDLGYEDVELCLTIREMGGRIRYVAESEIVHHESATGPERWRSASQNVALMNQRWGHR